MARLDRVHVASFELTKGPFYNYSRQESARGIPAEVLRQPDYENPIPVVVDGVCYVPFRTCSGYISYRTAPDCTEFVEQVRQAPRLREYFCGLNGMAGSVVDSSRFFPDWPVWMADFAFIDEKIVWFMGGFSNAVVRSWEIPRPRELCDIYYGNNIDCDEYVVNPSLWIEMRKEHGHTAEGNAVLSFHFWDIGREIFPWGEESPPVIRPVAELARLEYRPP